MKQARRLTPGGLLRRCCCRRVRKLGATSIESKLGLGFHQRVELSAWQCLANEESGRGPRSGRRLAFAERIGHGERGFVAWIRYNLLAIKEDFAFDLTWFD